MNIKVAIAEDIDDIRNGLHLIVNSTAGYTCDCICKNGHEALEKIPGYQPDVVLMDLGLPGMNGIKGTRRLKERFPQVVLLAHTVYEDDERIFKCSHRPMEFRPA